MTDAPATYQTDAWCYLNLDNPVCAWAAYRSVLVQAPPQRGFVSVWMASMLFANNPERAAREFALEKLRAAKYSNAVSRLKGMYVFTDRRSAELATTWGGAFSEDNLTDLSLAEAKLPGVRHDANWISYPATDDWMERYWSGAPHPDHEPIWESLAEGRPVILGTRLRELAFQKIKAAFPDALVLLETARLAAWIGYDLGNVAAFVSIKPPNVEMNYMIDMRDAANPVFLEKIVTLRDSGHPINFAEIGPLISKGAFVLPDLRPYGFVRPISEMSYLTS